VSYYYGGWAPYVPAAKRRQQAAKKIKQLSKKGQKVDPVVIDGRTIAKSFWGKAWCENLERYSDFENRLPRGRTYVRNGSVIDLRIAPERVTAFVAGSSIYEASIEIRPLAAGRWKEVKSACAGNIDSLVELLQGRFSKGVMEIITSKDKGLFPSPKEIALDCSCLDYAGLCKHLAAVLYGIGARLDAKPELLFLLRDVNHHELIAAATETPVVTGEPEGLDTGSLSALFGIEIAEELPGEKPKLPERKRRQGAVPKKRKKQPAPKKTGRKKKTGRRSLPGSSRAGTGEK
jgi:uncharacterized Zn finger protein